MRPQPLEEVSAVVLEALDNAWAPMISRTAGLTDDEYRWEPVDGCWTVRHVDGAWVADWADPDPVPPPVTTIAWRSWHIAVDCLDSYSDRLFGRRGSGLTGTAWVADWQAADEKLGAAWSVFRTGVATWTDTDLLVPLGPTWGPYANDSQLALALHATREVVHHSAEIALLRDLYARTR